MEFELCKPSIQKSQINVYFKGESTVVFRCTEHYLKPRHRMDSTHPRFRPQSWALKYCLAWNKSRIYCNQTDRSFGILTEKMFSYKFQFEIAPFQELELVFKWSFFRSKLVARRRDTDDVVLVLNWASSVQGQRLFYTNNEGMFNK